MSSAMELALKKQRLVFKSAALRQALAEDSRPLETVFSAADKVGDGLRWLRARPQLAVAATIALVVLRPRALLRWSRRGYFAWTALRKVQSLLRKQT